MLANLLISSSESKLTFFPNESVEIWKFVTYQKKKKKIMRLVNKDKDKKSQTNFVVL